jgi:hypothetical protein
MIYIGLDPGKGGGIAAVDDCGGVVGVVPMPETDQDILDSMLPYTVTDTRACLEFVRSSPQMGVTSAFTFGRGYGGLRMALAALQIPYTEVLPAKWQQALGCRSKGDKNVTKRRAQELFPHVKVTHAVADALLIAEYCRLSRAIP